jgi:methyl coenzyme M reductase subunit C-like uncharacterized protein (methanogenesis marker protein 7)
MDFDLVLLALVISFLLGIIVGRSDTSLGRGLDKNTLQTLSNLVSSLIDENKREKNSDYPSQGPSSTVSTKRVSHSVKDLHKVLGRINRTIGEKSK